MTGVTWNNKYAHSLLNMAHHILGNLEKRSTSSPHHPPPALSPTAVGFHDALGESTGPLIARVLLVLG